MERNTISKFIEDHYLHFNAAALKDAAMGMKNTLPKVVK